MAPQLGTGPDLPMAGADRVPRQLPGIQPCSEGLSVRGSHKDAFDRVENVLWAPAGSSHQAETAVTS